jgi:hypothetical protein
MKLTVNLGRNPFKMYPSAGREIFISMLAHSQIGIIGTICFRPPLGPKQYTHVVLVNLLIFMA